MSQCLIAVGANLGDRSETIRQAVSLLRKNAQFGSLAHSAWHETIPVGGPADQPPYLNGAIRLETALAPSRLLAELQHVERQLGRDRSERWGPRTIDLDLILYDNLVLSTPQLSLPHPRMAFRKFVLEPAVEVAPEMRHPRIGWTIRELYDHLLRATPYVAIAGAAGVGKSHLRAQLVSCFRAREIYDFIDTALWGDDDTNLQALAMEAHRQQFWRPATIDAPGPPPPRQIEWLRWRESFVSRAGWIEPDRLAVSDFWIEQSLAYAAVAAQSDEQNIELARGAAEELAEVEAAWGQTRDRLVPPKLLVLLDPPSHSHGALQTAIAARSTQPGLGPVLRLTSGDAQADFLEVAAALIAMQ